MKTRLSNWREESDLFEVVTGKMTDKEALKKVSEKKGINNKVTINPKLKEAVEDIGGEVLSVNEALAPSKKELNIMKKVNLLQLRLQKEKRKTTQKAEQAAKQQDDVPVQQEEVGISSSAAMEKARKEAELKAKEEAAVKKAKKVKEEFEAAVEYFYEQGINEEGLDLIIEEVGLDDFVDFVDFVHDETVFLNEERKARKMNVRTLKATKKKAEEIKASKKDVVARGTPSDTLARARTERSLKKPKLAKPAAKKEAPTPVKKAAAVIKTARKATVAKAKKDFDGDGKIETPKSEHRGVRNKKITKAVAKAKPAQPKKPASKEGLRAKIKSAYEAGVKRHKKAVQPARVFAKGMKAGAKKAVKFAKDVKKVVSEEELLEKDLSAAERRALPNKDFALPGKGEGPQGKQAGSYPIPDEKHARSALSLVSQHGTPAEKATVRAKVKKKFPNIKVSEGLVEPKDGVDSAKEVRKATRKAAFRPFNKEDYYAGTGEKVVARTKKYMDKKGMKGAPGLDAMKARAAEHKAKRGVKEDKALDLVRASIIKKHGKGAIYDPKTAKKPSEADKAKAAAERKKRQDADNKAFASRAKKAGYKNPQDYANVVARYGSEDNMKKGRGLGT